MPVDFQQTPVFRWSQKRMWLQGWKILAKSQSYLVQIRTCLSLLLKERFLHVSSACFDFIIRSTARSLVLRRACWRHRETKIEKASIPLVTPLCGDICCNSSQHPPPQTDVPLNAQNYIFIAKGDNNKCSRLMWIQLMRKKWNMNLHGSHSLHTGNLDLRLRIGYPDFIAPPM